MQEGGVGRVGRDLLGDLDYGIAGLIDGGEMLGANRGENDLQTALSYSNLGAFLANQTIANLVHETNFNSVYQQGEKFSMFVVIVDECCLLSIIFKAHLSVGAVKYFAMPAAKQIAKQMVVAQERDPGGGLDLSVLNLADPSELFKKKSA